MPKGLYGLNEPVNIEPIPHDVHVRLHQIMNIPYPKLALTRAWNGLKKPKLDPYWYTNTGKVEAVLDLQYVYYSRHKKLEQEWLRIKHIEKLNELTRYFAGSHAVYQQNFKGLWVQYSNALTHHYAVLTKQSRAYG